MSRFSRTRNTSHAADEPFSIGVLSELTGVPVALLRAWEQRHAVLVPQRSPGGHRRYRPADVERVRWLAVQIADGRRIGAAARTLRTLDELAGGRRRAAAGLARDALAGRGERVEARLDALFRELPLIAALEQAVFPALDVVGARWHESADAIVGEHLLSEAVACRVAARTASLTPERGPLGLICCPPGERHVLGGQVLAHELAESGWSTGLLGAETPLAAVARMASRRGAAAVVVVCTLAEPLAAALDEIAAAPATPWALAGPAADGELAARAGAAYWGPSFGDALRAAADPGRFGFRSKGASDGS